MKNRSLRPFVAGALFSLLFLPGCGYAPALPTVIPTFTVAVATQTPSPTVGPTGTPTPVPDATVKFALVQVLEGPAWHYGFVANLRMGDPIFVTGRDADCRWLQVVTASGASGWVNAEGGRVQLQLACEEIPFGAMRPGNGVIFLDRREKEAPPELRLNVSNQSESLDGVILLTDANNQPYLGFYIWAGWTVSVTGIPEGKYYFYFTVGEGWDMSNHRFVNNAFYGKLAEPIAFRVIYIFNSNTTKYSQWDFPLDDLAAGTYNSAEVQVLVLSAEQFPAFEWMP